MIGRLNHIALAVSDLGHAAGLYEKSLGASVSERQDLPEHGVSLVFVDLPNTKIELMQPLGETSPLEAFLKKSPSGGIHHICFEVPDIVEARETLIQEGARVLGDGKPKVGAHGRPVLFLHPKDFLGALIELEEAKAETD
jgi:methylmalonyl-CoA/ethylmalonyl-CoA epimerase